MGVCSNGLLRNRVPPRGRDFSCINSARVETQLQQRLLPREGAARMHSPLCQRQALVGNADCPAVVDVAPKARHGTGGITRRLALGSSAKRFPACVLLWASRLWVEYGGGAPLSRNLRQMRRPDRIVVRALQLPKTSRGQPRPRWSGSVLGPHSLTASGTRSSNGSMIAMPFCVLRRRFYPGSDLSR